MLIRCAHRHLTNVERRVQQLESLLTRLLPGVGIDEILARPDNAVFDTTSSSAPSPQSDIVQTLTLSREESNIVEVLPKEPDGFDWREEAADVASLTDGMASLSVIPSGTGYLGE